MSNYCDYSMRVQGPYQGVSEFIRTINRDCSYTIGYKNGKPLVYQYDTKGPHMCRVFEAYTDCDNQLPPLLEDGKSDVYIDGYCAWSVASCMMPNHGSYYDEFKDLLYHVTNLQELSKNHNLNIQVYSDECGMGFQEHIVIDNGLILDDDCVDVIHNYNEDTDEETIEGGYDNWDFYDANMKSRCVMFSNGCNSVRFENPL